MSAARSYKRLILSRPCLLVKQVFSFLWQKPFTSLFSEPSGKKAMCKAVTAAGADYIKTSTGFSKAGATFEDIKLFSEYIGPNVKMKAAGGISSLDDAEKFLALGADRLGTSRIIKLVKQEEATGY